MKRLCGIFFDEYGPRFGTQILGYVLVVVLVVGTVAGISYKVDSRSCTLKAHGLHLSHARFDFLSNTCFVTLPDGRNVDVDSLRFNEQGALVETSS